ncbi:cytochrome P450 CYP749A22-like [Primulina eburnea]|uniref:cytochrome P450 CYP749A22-like n=1 Tax=Primulina eburnea TaxID=1245227 RepID=UPI003C6C0267
MTALSFPNFNTTPTVPTHPYNSTYIYAVPLSISTNRRVISMNPVAVLFFYLSPLVLLAHFIRKLVIITLKFQVQFRNQCVNGPAYRPILGNSAEIRRRMIADAVSRPISGISHDIAHRVMPHYAKWSTSYGKAFLYWARAQAQVGCGGSGWLVGLEVEKWAVHGTITCRAFNMERIKGWIPEIVASTQNMLNKWEAKRAKKSDIELDVHEELHELSVRYHIQDSFR